MPRTTPAGLHTMAAVRALTGLTDRQLRYYDLLGLVVPRRSRGRHRLYTDAEVARLQQIRAMRARGLTLREVAADLARRPPPVPPSSPPPPAPP